MTINLIPLSSLLAVLACHKGAVGAEVKISNASSFYSFVSSVNSGTTYSGATVLLDSDLSISSKTIEPINYFRGIFDGQGHIISDLKMNSSSSYYAGLFGYSNGLTIRNVVLDSSCSIISSYKGSSNVFVGGIIGRCSANGGQCIIENSVNMASTTFYGNNSGSSDSYSYLGGIAGYLSSSPSNPVYVKNCVNYGSVTHSGTSKYLRIGGIVGCLSSSYYKYLYNCLNYGIITHNGSTSVLYAGGIVGYSNHTYIENSVSAGNILSLKSNYIGSIVGFISSGTYFNHCYYTSDVGKYNISGKGTPASTEGTPSSSTSVDSTLISNLNNYASDKGWNLWLLNTNNKTITFKINNNTELSLSSHIIVIPSLSSGWRGFIWFTDSSFTTKISSYSISSDKTFYGFWDNYTVTFDPNCGGVSTASKIVTYDSTYGVLPTLSRTGYSFLGWFTEETDGKKITSSTKVTTLSDVTLYAHWNANNYTVTFNLNDGDVSITSKNVTYGSTYGDLPNPIRNGYTFLGWFTETGGKKITFSTEVTTSSSHTLYAHWNANNYTVTFDPNDGSVSTTSKNVTYDSTYGDLPTPIRNGYSFLGWFMGKTDGKNITSSTKVETSYDHVLYAHWNANNYKVTFDTRREGSSVEPKTVQFEAVVSLPSYLTKGYCSIAFWETEYGDVIGFSLTMPDQNINLYAVWKCTRITTPDDFIDFAKVVNNGIGYSGTTVFLDSDLSLPGKTLEPIGNDYYFFGVFDGQGHIISDLKMNSSSEYTGLFEYSDRLTIKNIVLDSSCSITSSFTGSGDVYVGSIIGECDASGEQCNIENNVNMADITFSGNISKRFLYIGGISGRLYSSNPNAYVKNCANYGSVTHSGVSRYSYIGGIVGFLDGSSGSSSSYYTYLYNCLNYGTITHNGKTSNYLYIGGITGYSYRAHVENCVSAGSISTPTTASSKNYIGSIVGYVYSNTYINYCYFIAELNEYNLCGYGTPTASSYTLSYDNATFLLNENVSVGSYTGTSLINALSAYSDYYFLRDYSYWLLNKEKKSVKFTINNRISPIEMNYQIILLPNLATEGSISFDGWYNGSECTNPLESFEVTKDTALYGRFEENTNNYTITFDTKGGSYVASITARLGTVVSLPNDVIREHCSVAFWETEYGDYVGLSLTMPAHNFTLRAVWKCTHITTPDDFTDFSKIVNSGTTNYSGITVLLDSDLSLFGKALEPIGKDENNYFLGVFDGQGHVISDLKMNSTSSEYTGLFGYSKGLTIKNVVLDSSCSITSSHSDSTWFFVGGFIGRCYASSGHCNIENSVNMADVTFSGNGSSMYIYFFEIHLGGVAGYLCSYPYKSYVKNCANYGSVTHSGYTWYPYIGGVIGYINSGSNSYYTYIYNCLNYGTITRVGSVTDVLFIGGIAGYSYRAHIENCVSAGNISTSTTSSSINFIGSIVGYASYTYINYCYYTDDVGFDEINGYGSPNVTNTPNSSTDVNLTLIDNLNDYASSNSWSGWLLNEDSEAVKFTLNHRGSFSLSSRIILLPDIAESGELEFSGWYENAICNEFFQSPSIIATTALYGLYGVIINVTLDSNGGADIFPSKRVSINNTYGALPTPSRAGYTFDEWFTEDNEIVTGETIVYLSSEHALYAQWSANNYTVSFNANGSGVPDQIINVTFDSTYGSLPTPNRTGYTFAGWFTADNKTVTSETTVCIPNNHALYAQWTINSYTITFNYMNGEIIAYPLNFEETISYPENPEKEGYTFDGWDPAPNTMPAENLTITAQWVFSTIAIVLNKGIIGSDDAYEKIKEIIGDENAKVVVQDNGSGNSLTCVIKLLDEKSDDDVSEIIKNIVNDKSIKPAVEYVEVNGEEWNDPGSSNSSSTTIVIVVVIVVVVVIAVVAVILGFFLLRWKQSTGSGNDKNKVCKRVVNQDVQAIGASAFKSCFGKRKKIYPEDYVPPQNIVDALMKAGLGDDPANEAAYECKCSAEMNGGSKSSVNEFSVEDAAAVCLYTYDFGGDKNEMNPHNMLNNALRVDKNAAKNVADVRDILYLVMTALRKLPIKSGAVLYKGTREKVDENLYKEGNIVVWSGFSSTTPDRDSVETFLARPEDNKEAISNSADEIELSGAVGGGASGGTLFIIEDGWGYDIKSYSQFSNEEEILLEPERQFEVVKLEKSGDLDLVTLKMKSTKLILPEVFGKGQK